MSVNHLLFGLNNRSFWKDVENYFFVEKKSSKKVAVDVDVVVNLKSCFQISQNFWTWTIGEI